MRWIVWVLAALGFGATAQAEVLPVRWGEPAAAEEVAGLRGLALERFSGADGRALASQLETRLAAARDVAGAPYYALYALDSAAGAANVDAVVEGGANASVEENRVVRKRRYCIAAAEPRTNCKDNEKEEREVSCLNRIVALTSDVRVAREVDGRIIYRRAVSKRDDRTVCPTDGALPPAEDAIEYLLGLAATDYARDLAPMWQDGEIRVLESRKGLTKVQGETFKTALRATKTSPEEACRLLGKLADEAPAQRSVAFNVALCDEMRGDYERALAGYQALGPDREAAAAMRRVEATITALNIDFDRR